MTGKAALKSGVELMIYGQLNTYHGFLVQELLLWVVECSLVGRLVEAAVEPSMQKVILES